MPVAGWLSAHVIYPFCGDYVQSVTITSSIIMTFLVTVMCVCMQKLIIFRFKLTLHLANMCEVLFISLFFLIFRNRGTSACMFTAADLCCIYNYTIPGIVNAIVVLLLLRIDDMTEKFMMWKPIQRMLFFMLVYFSIFSHLFHSAITAIYAGVHLMLSLWFCKGNLRQVMKKNVVYISILAMWGVALVFEAGGGRAGSFRDEPDLIKVLYQLAAMIRAISKPFIIFSVVLLALTIVQMINKHFFNHPEITKLLVTIICNEVFLIIFLMLLNAKLAYMSRIDASWGMWFYLILMVTIVAAYGISEISFMPKAMQIIVPILVFASFYPDGKFLMSTRENADYQECVNLDYYVVNNIMEASKNGVTEITIYIPDHSDDLRFLAYSEGLGDIVANCLYTQGIIINKPVVHTIVDKSINDTFGN